MALNSIYHAAQLVALAKTSSTAALCWLPTSSCHAAQLATMVQICACAATGNTGQDAACVFQQLLSEHCPHVQKLERHQFIKQELLHTRLSVL